MIRLHLIANALLLWLGYYWLGVGEGSIPSLLWSAFVAVVLLVSAVLIHGAALAGTPWPGPIQAVRGTLRNLAPLVVLALVALAVYGLLAWWRNYSETPALNIASWLTLKTRKPVKPESVLKVFNFFLWFVRWMIVPCGLLPLAASMARDGWKGIAKSAWKKPKLYWILVPLLLVVAVWLPLKLVTFGPLTKSFTVQMLTFSLRAVIAYVLFVGGLLALARVTSQTTAPAEAPSPATT